MTRYVNYEATGNIAPVDQAEVTGAISAAKDEVLTAIANSGMPGEIKLVYRPDGTVPAGTTRLDIPTDQVIGTLNTVQLASLGNFAASGDENASNVFGATSSPAQFGAAVLDNSTHAFLINFPNTNTGRNLVLWDKASGAWARTALPISPGGTSTTTDLWQHTKTTHLLENNNVVFINWGKYGAALNSSISPSSFFYTFNGSSWTTRSSANVNFWYAHSFSIGNNVYLLGGGQTANGSGQQATRFLKYDAVANSWTTLATPPFNCNAYYSMYTDTNNAKQAYTGGGKSCAQTCTHSAVQIGTKIYVALNGYYNTDGGTLVTDKSADTFVTAYIYDTIANSWSSGVQITKPITVPVFGTASQLVGTLVAYNGELYLAGALMVQEGGLGVRSTQLKKLSLTDLSVISTVDVSCPTWSSTGVPGGYRMQANAFSYAQGSAPKLMFGSMWMVGGPAFCAALGTYKVNTDNVMYVYKN